MIQIISILLPLVSLSAVGFYSYKKDKFDYAVIAFLIATIFVETCSLIMSSYVSYNRQVLYNIYSLIVFLLFIKLFQSLIHTSRLKHLFKWAPVGLIFIFIADAVINTNITTAMQILTYISGAIILVSLVSAYLIQLLQSDQVMEFYKSKHFWVSLGLLLFYIPFIPVIICLNYALSDAGFIMQIIIALNVIMHACFLIAYLWASKMK